MVELMIVVTIIAVIGTVSLVNLLGWRNQKELSSASQKVATLVREAEGKAMSQEKGASWGIHFENDGINPPFYAIFSGSSYSVSAEIERYYLHNSLAFDGDSLASGERRDIIFDQITGKPKISQKYTSSDLSTWVRLGSGWRMGSGPTYTTISGNSQLIILKSIRGNTTSSVIVYPSGSIAFDSISCILTCFRQVVVLLPPVALSLVATPTSTTPSGSVTLSWNTINADSCEAPWTSSRASSGSQVINPSQTAVYSIECIGGGIEATANVSVEVTTGGGGRRGPPQRN